MRRTIRSLVAAALLTGLGALAAAQQPPPVPEVTGGGDDLVKKKGYMFQFRDVAAHGGASTVAGTLRNVDPYPVSAEAKKKAEEKAAKK